MIYTHEQVEELLKQQRLNCLLAYTDYYAGSAEDFAPECVVRDIANAPYPVNFTSQNNCINSRLVLTELEERRFRESNPKQITFFFGGGIGVKKEIIDDDGDELDITDYGKW